MKERQTDATLDRALSAARDTRFVRVEHGACREAGRFFASAFGGASAVIVADSNTFQAAGGAVLESLRGAGIVCDAPFVFGRDVRAEFVFVEKLQAALGATASLPVAVGSGTINDLTKLAAHRLGRPYLAVATAASMDGYTAFGASITHNGSKQTFECAAPRAVLADLEVIAHAPRAMNASGYADLLAKGAAGADWILADAAGEEPIAPAVWDTVQAQLPAWCASAGGVARGEPDFLRRLVVGLMMSGFAMQAAQSSRPASGAEHQFSHLWDMQHHLHDGVAPSHGFKVGIGTLASLDLYQVLLRRDFARLDVAAAVDAWRSWEQVESRIRVLFGSDALAQKSLEETGAKHPSADALRAQLCRLRDGWPALRTRLERQLLPFRQARALLAEAGCPIRPEQIGISSERLRQSYELAYYIRRRFTVLDFAMRTGMFAEALDEVFAG
ncbi:MAG TPA: sn-glycerol-1-phosphate dehydrogenase [Pirellulales bacterium]|nr:sn-glycerol-1-phosphate dehydrogenase [Pirellulales bacterium]